MTVYTKPALAGNAEGLPKFKSLPLFDYRANPTNPHNNNLTLGGRVVHQRTRRPAETCNLIASLAGIGQEYDHAR